ncbi:MAG: hypothetical protein JST68_21775 [Bacteroidetes bacterium]|nr:hypothetical protein [Bacteroidota bacterium]
MKFTTSILAIVVFLSACKKNGGSGGGGGTNNTNVMYPATLSYYEGNNSAYPAKSTFKYDDKHHLTYYGNEGRWTSLSGNGVQLVVPGGYDTTILVYNFSGNIYTGEVGQVESYYINKINGGSTTGPKSTYSLIGMTAAKNTSAIANLGKVSQYLKFDGNGDVASSYFITNAWGSPNSTQYDPGGLIYDRLTFTGYDTKPSPYSAIPEYKFTDFPWSYPERMSFDFSQHNPGKIVEESLNQTTMTWSTYRETTFTYTYTDQGYPSQVKITTYYPSSQGPSGQNTYYATYNFTYAK